MPESEKRRKCQRKTIERLTNEYEGLVDMALFYRNRAGYPQDYFNSLKSTYLANARAIHRLVSWKEGHHQDALDFEIAFLKNQNSVMLRMAMNFREEAGYPKITLDSLDEYRKAKKEGAL